MDKCLRILYIQTILINEHLYEWISWNTKVANEDEGDFVEKRGNIINNFTEGEYV